MTKPKLWELWDRAVKEGLKQIHGRLSDGMGGHCALGVIVYYTAPELAQKEVEENSSQSWNYSTIVARMSYSDSIRKLTSNILANRDQLGINSRTTLQGNVNDIWELNDRGDWTFSKFRDKAKELDV